MNLYTHTDHLSRNKISTSRDKCTSTLSTGLSAIQILRQGSTPIASQTAVQLTQCFRSTILLTHMLGIACAIEMAIGSDEWSKLPSGATTATRTRSGTSVIRRSRVPPHAWVGPITSWSQPDTVAKSRAAIPRWFVVVEPNHYWWWPFKSPTNRNEARASFACKAAIAVSK